jgi:hypothetical protein
MIKTCGTAKIRISGRRFIGGEGRSPGIAAATIAGKELLQQHCGS